MGRKINQLYLLFILLLGCQQAKNQGAVNNSPIIEVSEAYSQYEDYNRIGFYIGKIENDSIKVEFEKNKQPKNDDEFTDESKWFYFPKVTRGSSLIYYENDREIFSIKQGEARILSFGSSVYILLTRINRIDVDNWIVLWVKNGEISVSKVLSSKIFDIDLDGKLEIGGFHVSESPCGKCDSAYYRVAQFYELGDTFQFDSLASKMATEKAFGIFLGYQAKDTVLFRQK